MAASCQGKGWTGKKELERGGKGKEGWKRDSVVLGRMGNSVVVQKM